MSIERWKNVERRACSYLSGSICTHRRLENEGTFYTCQGCPLWRVEDALYEDIMGRQVKETYDWWRKEWLDHGIPYAFERALDFVTMSASKTEPEVTRFDRARNRIGTLIGHSITTWVLIGIVLTVTILRLTLGWYWP